MLESFFLFDLSGEGRKCSENFSQMASTCHRAPRMSGGAPSLCPGEGQRVSVTVSR